MDHQTAVAEGGEGLAPVVGPVPPALEVSTAATPALNGGVGEGPVLNTPVMFDAAGNITVQYVEKLKADQQVTVAVCWGWEDARDNAVPWGRACAACRPSNAAFVVDGRWGCHLACIA
jgi:hypothetical protein